MKRELEGALDLLHGRLDLIQKVDVSKVGWSAAVFYEKSNGPVFKAESGKLWSEAEKQASEAKKNAASKEKYNPSPFRAVPAGSGRFQSFQRTSRGLFSWVTVYFVLLRAHYWFNYMCN